ncbi:Hypothetical predicted protein [Paramuricea clavata]|uniref:Uncharacterized protein n=1 Tax=Paramuricea clavata TaxID=317549 RepID=A0A7D9L283_PARCT|nr:Hypothetical predicted protein [Paramuricea clavata]
MTAAGEHFEEKFKARNDCLKTICFGAVLITKAEVIPRNPQIMLHQLEQPDDDLGDALTPREKPNNNSSTVKGVAKPSYIIRLK